jgi:hypothetical protein
LLSADAGYALVDFGLDLADVLVDEVAVVYAQGAANIDAFDVRF